MRSLIYSQAGGEIWTRKKALRKPHVANYITPAILVAGAGIEPAKRGLWDLQAYRGYFTRNVTKCPWLESNQQPLRSKRSACFQLGYKGKTYLKSLYFWRWTETRLPGFCFLTQDRNFSICGSSFSFSTVFNSWASRLLSNKRWICLWQAEQISIVGPGSNFLRLVFCLGTKWWTVKFSISLAHSSHCIVSEINASFSIMTNQHKNNLSGWDWTSDLEYPKLPRSQLRHTQINPSDWIWTSDLLPPRQTRLTKLRHTRIVHAPDRIWTCKQLRSRPSVSTNCTTRAYTPDRTWTCKTPDLNGRCFPITSQGWIESGWQDLNPQPSPPKGAALPSCATSRLCSWRDSNPHKKTDFKFAASTNCATGAKLNLLQKCSEINFRLKAKTR